MTTRSLSAAAAPPFISQLAFSGASFFTITGLARNANATELVTVIAAYSLESIAVSYGNARWIGLLVHREEHSLRLGDLSVMSKSFLTLIASIFPFLFLGAYLVGHDSKTAFWAAAWAASMGLADLGRLAASRFLFLAPVFHLSLLHLACTVCYTFLIDGSVPVFLAGLTGLNLVFAVANWTTLHATSEDGISTVWKLDSGYGKALGAEGLLSSMAVGLSGAAISIVNPNLAVGLQLGNQILGMPATAISQAVGLPLVRRARARLSAREYPRRLIMAWGVFGVMLPLMGFAMLHPLRPLISLLLGEKSEQAYFFLPVILIQSIMILSWEPALLARRWTNSPENARNHVVITVLIYFAALVALASMSLSNLVLRDSLMALASVGAFSTLLRATFWYGAGWGDSDS